MRLVLSISEKAARALRVAAAEQGHRGVSAYIETLYGFDSLPVAPLTGDPEQLVVALDCGFGPDTYAGIDRSKDEFWKSGLIDSERAKEIVSEEGTLGEGHE